MDAKLLKDAEQALKVAKITLMMQKHTVCYTTVIFSLKQEITDIMPTAATDGRQLLINPTFWTELSPNERLTILAHEALHVLLDHMHRKGDRDHKLWNIAGDYVINGALKNAGYVLPNGTLYNKEYDGKTTEEVYKLLDKKTDVQKQALFAQCQNGSLNGNDITYPDQVDPDKAVTKEEVTGIILRATTQAKTMGQPPGVMPAEIDVELQKTINPPLPWNIILQNYLTSFAKEDFSFRRPNKRFLPNYYLPTAHSEAICDLAVVVDISSSVTDHEFNVFINKIDEIKKVMKPNKMTVVSFNTKIVAVQELKADDNPLTKLKFKGRGGTAIGPVMDWMNETKPTVTLIFTDGDFTQVEPSDKKAPIVWVIHDNPAWKYPWGKIIHYKID